MKKCPNCGNSTESKFCPECGTNLTDVQETYICPNCGAEVTSKFCPECGADVTLPIAADIPVSIENNTNNNIAQETEKSPPNPKKKALIIVCAIIGALIIIGIFVAINSNSYEDDYDDYSYEDDYDDYDDEEDYDDYDDDDTSIYGKFTKESDYAEISYDELARNPDDHEFEKVKFTGEVVQVLEGDDETQLRIAVDDYWDDIIYVYYDSSIVDSRVLEDDIVTCYGESMNLYTYESTNGGDITIPLVEVHKIVVQ